MADMLVKLYEFAPDLNLRRKLESKGFTVRRALPPERSTVLRWVAEEFGKEWADECAVAFARQPSTCFIALQEDGLAGFSCCEATCRAFFGPTGVRPDLRRQGLGKALLDIALEDLKARGYAYAIVGDAGPLEFYERYCGAVPIPDSVPGIYKGMLR